MGGLVWWQNNSKMADGRHFENRSPYLNEKSSNFHVILYTAADFELGKRHLINNEKELHWTDSEFDRRQNAFLV